MTHAIDAVYEGGVFRPLTKLHLVENQVVRIIIESEGEQLAKNAIADPLAGLSCDTGIADLAENFDDYRFGRRQP